MTSYLDSYKITHPPCVCGKTAEWKNLCGVGYVCLCECHEKEKENKENETSRK